jgi:cbb3-type cytochrome c oxidase subunit III
MRRAILLAFAAAAAACQDMYDQPRYKTYAKSTFFGDGLSSRPSVPGTIARGHQRTDELFETGKVDGRDAELYPFPVTRAVLERGRERYEIFCSPCHDRAGTGRGMVVQRGFKPPPSFHQDRLRNAAPGHFFDVITHGFGAMYAYAARVPPRDRWAITAYIRALQLSRSFAVADLSSEERARVEAGR